MRRSIILTASVFWLAILALCFAGYGYHEFSKREFLENEKIWDDLGAVLELHRLLDERSAEIAVLSGPDSARKVQATRARLQQLHRRHQEQLAPLVTGGDAVAAQARKLSHDLKTLTAAEAGISNRADVSAAKGISAAHATAADQLVRLRRMLLDRTRRDMADRHAAFQGHAWPFALAAVVFTLLIGGTVVLLERRFLSPLQRLRASIHAALENRITVVDSAGATRAVKTLLDEWNETATLQRFQIDRARQRALRTKMSYTRMFAVLQEEVEQIQTAVHSGTWFQNAPDGKSRDANQQDVEQILSFLKEFAAYGLLPTAPELPPDEFTDVNHVLRDVVARGRSFLERKYLEVRYHAPDTSVSLDVHVEFEQMKRAFMNLLAFVYKATRPHTTLTFHLSPLETRHAELRVTFVSNASTADEIDFLLHRFRKTGSRGRIPAGLFLIQMGMGLPLVNHVIHQAGGTVHVMGGKDHQITVVCRLPIARAVRLPSHSENAGHAPAQENAPVSRE